jgi:hypothetical protein
MSEGLMEGKRELAMGGNFRFDGIGRLAKAMPWMP